jgi:putative ABC transport system permease protein
VKPGIFLLETAKYSLGSIRQNKLRSVLSVLGITIGIYCIIAVYALVHSMEININRQFTKFGTDVVFVQKWPWDQWGSNYPWWKFLGRPVSSPTEAQFIEDKMVGKMAEKVAYIFSNDEKIQANATILSGTTVQCISENFAEIQDIRVETGRLFMAQEINSGEPVAVIGSTIARELFSGRAIGQKIRIGSRICSVIGVIELEGSSIINNSKDDQVFIPLTLGLNMYSYRDNEDAQILIKAAKGVTLDDLTVEVDLLLRQYRKIKPGKESNFAVNRMTMITSAVSELFSQIQKIGVVIGGFAMLVGCFGVANIMFVSVKERTKEIGIQKALGAPSIFIQLQFLLEAVWLCILGGLIGMLLVWLTFIGLNAVLKTMMDGGVTLILSPSDTYLGLWVSAAVGVLAGFIPATRAARLNPVEAMRAK